MCERDPELGPALMRVLRSWLSAFALFSLFAGAAVASTTVTYTYDVLGRVTAATYSDGTSATFAYDAAGNRTAQTTSVAPPVANPVSQAVAVNSTNNVINLNITGGAPASVAVSTAATHGAAAAVGATIQYTPTVGFSGLDSFAYIATNGGGTSAPATASITVAPHAQWGSFNWGSSPWG